MSAHPDDPHGHGGHDVRPVRDYVAIILILTVITFLEIGPLFEWYNLPASVLIVMSLAKFVLVVAFFMHLADDHSFFTQVFFGPLVGAVLMVMVLMLLFNSYVPSPTKDAFAVQERHWTNYSGECSSWLRSHVSNRWYCASPAVNTERLYAEYVPRTAGGSAAAPALDFAGLTDAEKQDKLYELGEKLYSGKGGCAACHQANGAGIPGAFPPLAGSDYKGFLDPVEHARIIVHGLNGEIVVNGVTYNGAMQAFGALSDDEIAAIATYERNAWGNSHGLVTPEQVASIR